MGILDDKKKLILLGIFLLVLPLISALDGSLPMVCGGDDELIIGCLDLDEELTFLSREVPPAGTGPSGGGGVVISVEEPEEPEIEIEEEEEIVIPFFSIFGLDKLTVPAKIIIIILLFAFTFFFIFIYKKRKKKKETKKLEKKKV